YVFAYTLNRSDGQFTKRLLLPDLGESLSLTALAHKRKLAVTTVNSGRDLVLWKTTDGEVVRRIESQARTPVRVAWLKEGGRHVLAWGYGQKVRDPDFGKLTHAFDLDNLEFVPSVQPKDFTGRLHQLGPWSVAYKETNSRVHVEVKKDTKAAAELEQKGTG